MDPKELFTRVMDDMVRAGWLHSHVFTEGKGHHLVWTEQGALYGLFIKTVARQSGLEDGDRSAVAFDMLCRGKTLPVGIASTGDADERIAIPWCELVDGLGYEGDEDKLRTLVHICVGWAVDGETGVRFG